MPAGSIPSATRHSTQDPPSQTPSLGFLNEAGEARQDTIDISSPTNQLFSCSKGAAEDVVNSIMSLGRCGGWCGSVKTGSGMHTIINLSMLYYNMSISSKNHPRSAKLKRFDYNACVPTLKPSGSRFATCISMP